jgi:hypothetical protein
MYAFFRVVVALPARRLTPPDRLLEQQGFRLDGRRDREWGLLRSDLWRRVSEQQEPQPLPTLSQPDSEYGNCVSR